jgi:hypothetical protein
MLTKNIKTKMDKTRCLALVSQGYKTWSVTLKEEHRLRLSKNEVMRNIFGLRSKMFMWEWRILHDGELYDLNRQTNIIRVIKSRRMLRPGHVAHWERGKNVMAGACGTLGERKECYGRGMWHTGREEIMLRSGHVAHWERGKMHVGFWWGDLKERDRLKNLAVD